MSGARPLFLQLAEIHLRTTASRKPRPLEKTSAGRTDNLRIPDPSGRFVPGHGPDSEAIEAYVSASQRAVARGDHGESEKARGQRALKLEPNNLAASLSKRRSYSSQGNLTKAAQLLEQAADLEKGGEQTELLSIFISRIPIGQASALAHRYLKPDEKNFGPMQKVVELLLQSGMAKSVRNPGESRGL